MGIQRGRCEEAEAAGERGAVGVARRCRLDGVLGFGARCSLLPLEVYEYVWMLRVGLMSGDEVVTRLARGFSRAPTADGRLGTWGDHIYHYRRRWTADKDWRQDSLIPRPEHSS